MRPRVFFPFSNVISVLQPPFLFHHLLYNELLAAEERKGEGLISSSSIRWRLVEGKASRASLLCQWTAALVWPRDGGGWGRRRRGSLVLAKKIRGMTEGGMREVMA
jgi:hypothetical protein